MSNFFKWMREIAVSQPRECWTASPALLCAFHGFPLPPSLQCLPQPYLGFLSTPVPPKLPSAVDPFWRVLFLSLPPLSRIFVYDLLHAFSVLFLHFSDILESCWEQLQPRPSWSFSSLSRHHQIQARVCCFYFTFLQGTGWFSRGKNAMHNRIPHRDVLPPPFWRLKAKGNLYLTTIIHYLTFLLFSEKQMYLSLKTVHR